MIKDLESGLSVMSTANSFAAANEAKDAAREAGRSLIQCTANKGSASATPAGSTISFNTTPS
jgi:hypothetical protein